MSNKIYYNVFLSVFLLIIFVMPVVALAQADLPAETADFFTRLGTIISSFTIMISGLALIFFIVSLIRFIYHAGDEEKRKEGKKGMGWSIIALFVMVSIWGIVVFLRISILGDGEAGKTNALPPPTIDSEYYNN